MGFGYRHSGRGHGWGRGQGRKTSHLHTMSETTLDTLHGGDEVEIVDVADNHARMHTLRFGMAEGAHARCVTRIPAGPIVMLSGRQEIAVGRRLARRIHVRHIEHSHDESSQAG